jgi:hypothetical protein
VPQAVFGKAVNYVLEGRIEKAVSQAVFGKAVTTQFVIFFQQSNTSMLVYLNLTQADCRMTDRSQWPWGLLRTNFESPIFDSVILFPSTRLKILK